MEERTETIDQVKVKETISLMAEMFEKHDIDPVVAVCALKVMMTRVEEDLLAHGIKVNIHAVMGPKESQN